MGNKTVVHACVHVRGIDKVTMEKRDAPWANEKYVHIQTGDVDIFLELDDAKQLCGQLQGVLREGPGLDGSIAIAKAQGVA